MAGTSADKDAPKARNAKDERLKAALKANMARRKAQLRARAAEEPDDTGQETPDKEG
jgi:hypothetical protein